MKEIIMSENDDNDGRLLTRINVAGYLSLKGVYEINGHGDRIGLIVECTNGRTV